MVRHKETGIVILSYENRKCVMLGAKSRKDADVCVDWYLNCSKCTLTKQLEIRNLVYIFDSGTGIILSKLFCFLRYKGIECRFEPEICPAVVLVSPTTQKPTILIYRSGKVTITGSSCASSVRGAISFICKTIGIPEPVFKDF